MINMIIILIALLIWFDVFDYMINISSYDYYDMMNLIIWYMIISIYDYMFLMYIIWFDVFDYKIILIVWEFWYILFDILFGIFYL